jgi:hypothetical protein
MCGYPVLLRVVWQPLLAAVCQPKLSNLNSRIWVLPYT